MYCSFQKPGGNQIRQIIKEFVHICATCLPIDEPIYEFGSLQVPGQEGYGDLRPLFPGKLYVGADIRAGPGVDRILDIHSVDLPSGSVGTALVLDTLEHVESPSRAIEELGRVLTQKGILIMSSVMNFPIHDYPSDFWRFTPAAFRILLRDYSFSVVESCGRSDFPHTIVGVGFKGPVEKRTIHRFEERLTLWKEINEISRPHGIMHFFTRISPPVIADAVVKIRPPNH